MDTQITLFMLEDVLWASTWLALLFSVVGWMWYCMDKQKIALVLSIACTILFVIVVLFFAGIDSYNETAYGRPPVGRYRGK